MSASWNLTAYFILHFKRHSAQAALGILLIVLATSSATGQRVVGTITHPGMIPTAVAVYEAGNKVFVADSSTGNLYTYDGNTLAELNSIYVGPHAYSLVIDEARGKIFVGSLNDRKVAVIAATTGGLIKFLAGTYTNMLSSQSLVLDPGLGKLYILSYEGLTQVDEASYSETLVPGFGGGGYEEVAVNTATHEVFVDRYIPFDLAIVNPTTYAITAIPNMGALGVCANPQDNKVYTAYPLRIFNRNNGSVTRLDLNENDATKCFYNSLDNRVYTDSEVDGLASIFEGTSDAHFNLPMAPGTTALGFRQSTHHVYFAAQKFIAILDENTHLVETIPIDNPSPNAIEIQSIAINQTTGRVYVINDGNGLPVISVVQDADTMSRPPVYVGGPSKTFVMDSATDIVTDELRLAGSMGGLSLAVRPGGGRIYQPTEWRGSVLNIYAGIDQSSGLTSIGTGGTNPAFAAVTPDGSRVYVTNDASGNVGVIDGTTNEVLTTVGVGNNPRGIAIGPDGTKAYVANQDGNSVSVIATSSNTVSTTIPVGTKPDGVAVNPSGTKVYVTNTGANTVAVINTATNTVTTTVPVGTTPDYLAITPDGKYAYVVNSGGGTVSVIDTGTDTVVGTIPVGTDPRGIAILPNGTKAYVAHLWVSRDR